MLPDVDESDQVKAVDPNKVQAAAQYPVQIIEFYPQGWGVGRDDLARLSNMSASAGRFYQYQIQGQTLNMLPARVATGQKDLSYYLNYCGWIKQIAGCTRGSLTSILYGIYETDRIALGASGKSTILYLPMQINDPAACGVAFYPNISFGLVDHASVRCGISIDPNPENRTIVHEMGHTFGLTHVSSQYSFDIMDVSSTRCIYGPPSNCLISNSGKQKITTPKYFQPDPIYTAGYSLVHRIFNGNNGKHLYSNDIAEINEDLRNGWYWDGISWMIYPTAKTGTKQLTRFYDPAGDNRVMTIDDTEKLNIQPPRGRWLPESYPIMYAMPNATADMPTAISRVYNPANGDRIYTLDPQEIRNTTAAGWLNEGVRFWAKRY